MFPDRARPVLAALPDAQVYPIALLGLVPATALALALDSDVLGVGGVLALSLISLAYGADRASRS